VRRFDPVLQKLRTSLFMRSAHHRRGDLPPPVPRLVSADAGNALDAQFRPNTGYAAGDMPYQTHGGAIVAAGHALFPHAGCDILGLIISLPRGWSIPGRGAFSDQYLPAAVLPIKGADLRCRVADLLADNAGTDLPFPCMHAAADLADAARAGLRHVVLKFNPALPAAPDGLLHFSFPPACSIDYTPAHCKADFRLTLVPPETGGKARILFHSFAAPTLDAHSGIRRQTHLSRGAFLEIYATESPLRAAAHAEAAVIRIRTEIVSNESAADAGAGKGTAEDAGARESNAAPPRRNPGVSMDFPSLGKGDVVTGLRFQAPDPSKGRIFYRGEPVAADADGIVTLRGDDFDPARIAFTPTGEWEGTVHVAFAATVENFHTKEERESPGTVTFTIAAPVTRTDDAGCGQIRDIAGLNAENAAQHTYFPYIGDEEGEVNPFGFYPEQSERHGKGGMPVAESALALSDVGDLVSTDLGAVVSSTGGESIRAVARGGILQGHFPFDEVGTPGGMLFAGVSSGGGDAVKLGPEGLVCPGRFGELRVACDGKFEYEADRDGAGPVWEYFTWTLYGADGRIEEGRLYVAVAGNP
jgi:hypothetical protein